MSERHAPFKTLGDHLKYLREQSQETLAEVSGAVEIDENTLSNIEEGVIRPQEEILLLLISHFSMGTQQALQVWELAGYEGEPDFLRNSITSDINKGMVMVMTTDPRTIYSDGIDIDTNQAGMTLNFLQQGKNKPTIVSKIGMSIEQAEKVYQKLQAELMRVKYQKGPQQLPENSQNSPDNQ